MILFKLSFILVKTRIEMDGINVKIVKMKIITNKTYAIFGLGRYGKSVTKELVKNGIPVGEKRAVQREHLETRGYKGTALA